MVVDGVQFLVSCLPPIRVCQSLTDRSDRSALLPCEAPLQSAIPSTLLHRASPTAQCHIFDIGLVPLQVQTVVWRGVGWGPDRVCVMALVPPVLTCPALSIPCLRVLHVSMSRSVFRLS